MFIRLLVASFFVILVVQSDSASRNSKGQRTDNLRIPKQPDPPEYDYDINDNKYLGGDIEGSGGAASPDEYADDEEEEELARVTAKYISTTLPTTTTRTTTTPTTSTTTTTTSTTTTTMTMPSTTRRTSATPRTTTSSTTVVVPWMRASPNLEPRIGKNRLTTSTTTVSVFDDMDANEFKDDQDEYLDGDNYDDDVTVINKMTTTTTTTVSTTRFFMPSTRRSSQTSSTPPFWIILKVLSNPPIVGGILAALAIGILTSVVLLICIIQRYQKRDKSHSSYTTGLLYPNQYGYSKSPQEFYA